MYNVRYLWSLANSLQRRGADGRASGWWTKRIDACDTFYIPEDAEEMAYSLDIVLKHTPNLAILTIPVREDSPDPCAIFWALQPMQDLTRIELFGTGWDVGDFQVLSQTCPKLQHIFISLSPSLEAQTDAISICFPFVTTLLLEWLEIDDADISPPFLRWDFPSIRHLSFFLHRHDNIRMILPFIDAHRASLRSLEFPTIPKNVRYPYLDVVLPLVPNLETLIVDVFKASVDDIAHIYHASLRQLGWRLRLGSSMNDITTLNAHYQYFNKEMFPQLERITIVHPHDLEDYTDSIILPIRGDWNRMVCGDVPIVDLHGSSAAFSEEELHETFEE